MVEFKRKDKFEHELDRINYYAKNGSGVYTRCYMKRCSLDYCFRNSETMSYDLHMRRKRIVDIGLVSVQRDSHGFCDLYFMNRFIMSISKKEKWQQIQLLNTLYRAICIFGDFFGMSLEDMSDIFVLLTDIKNKRTKRK